MKHVSAQDHLFIKGTPQGLVLGPGEHCAVLCYAVLCCAVLPPLWALSDGSRWTWKGVSVRVPEREVKRLEGVGVNNGLYF